MKIKTNFINDAKRYPRLALSSLKMSSGFVYLQPGEGVACRMVFSGFGHGEKEHGGG